MSEMSREEAIAILETAREQYANNCIKEAFDMAIEALKEQRPRGEWLISPDKTRACCPFCHTQWEDASEIAILGTAFRGKNFCEYCGADMRGDENETK